MEQIKKEMLPGLMRCIAKKMEEKSEELCAMDARFGDGDLGLTMKKGFSYLAEYADKISIEQPSKFFMQCGMELSSQVPSTMGFLMGQGLMTAGKALMNREKMGGEDYSIFLKGFSNGIRTRGKCEPGDRTILDAMEEAAGEAERYCMEHKGAGFTEVAAAAVSGAEAGAERTKEMLPKFGKAAVHKTNVLGTIDQGAMAGVYLLKAIYEFSEASEAGDENT